MTNSPLWQRQRDAMQAETQAAETAQEPPGADSLADYGWSHVAESQEELRLQTVVWGAQGTETGRIPLADYPNPYNPLGEWYIMGTLDPAPPPLTRAQIAQDLARYGHDPSALLGEWDAFTQRTEQGVGQDRLQLGTTIYRLARPDEIADLWVSDPHEGIERRGYVRL